MEFIQQLTASFTVEANAENAKAMAKYMKNRFPFLGLKTEMRRTLLKEAERNHMQELKGHCRTIALKLYELPEREYHYCAVDILIKQLKKNFTEEDIQLIEYLLITHSWWDTVDAIAKYLLGGYLMQFPEKIKSIINDFSGSDNMWLNRSALLYQLSYKSATNEKALFHECKKHSGSDEFFIKKAIGWALREYGKTSPESVREFVANSTLKPLSEREALKNL